MNKRSHFNFPIPNDKLPGPVLWLSLAVTVLVGCGAKEPPPKAEPPIVTVATPIEDKVGDFAPFTGRTEAVESVEIRARVSGYLTKVAFQEGAEINKGDLLYEIDAR